jgi:hypothetical protein
LVIMAPFGWMKPTVERFLLAQPRLRKAAALSLLNSVLNTSTERDIA